MSVQSSKYLKFGIAIAVILVSLGYLAYTGVQQSKSYYVTIKELRGMDASVYSKTLRVPGTWRLAPFTAAARASSSRCWNRATPCRCCIQAWKPRPTPSRTTRRRSPKATWARWRVSRHAIAGEVRLQVRAQAQPGAAGRRARQGHEPGGRALHRLFSVSPSSAESGTTPSPTPGHPDPVVVLRDVTKQFGRFAALRGVTAEFAAGKMYAVLGDNGAGKTTLLRTLVGLSRPSSGTVHLLGASDLRSVTGELGYMAHPRCSMTS